MNNKQDSILSYKTTISLWKIRQNIEVEIAMLRENQVVEETTLLNKIQKNNIKEQEVQQKLEKDKNYI